MMAIIQLLKLFCLHTSGGRIQLKVNSEPLLLPSQFTGEIEPFPMPVSFISTIAIELFDDSDETGGLSSVGFTEAITDLIEPAGRRTIVYDNGFCSGSYIVDYEVIPDNPNAILVA